MPLRTGKLPPPVLQNLVLSRLGVTRPDVLVTLVWVKTRR